MGGTKECNYCNYSRYYSVGIIFHLYTFDNNLRINEMKLRSSVQQKIISTSFYNNLSTLICKEGYGMKTSIVYITYFQILQFIAVIMSDKQNIITYPQP